MPPLGHALLFRLFGTKRLAAESGLVLTSLLLLLGLAPCLLRDVLYGVIAAAIVIAAYAFIGLFAFILPGLLIGLVGYAVLLTLLILFARGCWSLAVRYLNWGLGKYYDAQEDVYLNGLFGRDS